MIYRTRRDEACRARPCCDGVLLLPVDWGPAKCLRVLRCWLLRDLRRLGWRHEGLSADVVAVLVDGGRIDSGQGLQRCHLVVHKG